MTKTRPAPAPAPEPAPIAEPAASGLGALAEFTERHLQPRQITIGNDGVPGAPATVGAVLVPEGYTLSPVKDLLEPYRMQPSRRTGTAALQDLDSLIAFANRFKAANSALFGHRSDKTPSLTAVIDYHPAGADIADARFGKHRGVYMFPLSKAWIAWRDQDSKPMDQADFAAFLEDRIIDVVQPPDFNGAEYTAREYVGNALLTDAQRRERDQAEADLKLKEFARLVGSDLAGPTKLMELSRGLTVNAASRVKNAQNLANGEISVQYEEQHQDSAGAPLKVPSLFLIAIPVFELGAIYRLAVRLRYRLAGGAIKWFFQIHRADLTFDHAFKEACERAKVETGLPLFIGAPEA